MIAAFRPGSGNFAAMGNLDITIKRTSPADDDFRELARALEAELKVRDGENHAYYAALNQAGNLIHAVVVYHNGLPAGCGAFRPYQPGIMELKRMFVPESFRRKGIASAILTELEAWCRELSMTACVLETGLNQPEAIAFYRLHGYRQIPNFATYSGSPNSICFKKELVNGKPIIS